MTLIFGNACVASGWLHYYATALPAADPLRCFRRDAGCFDFRANIVVQALHKLKHHRSNRKFDQWLFPDETLTLGGGDCEDLAFVLAALLSASRISAECVRVALGAIIDYSEPDKPMNGAHAWVVSQRENSAWEISEPLVKVHWPKSAGSDEAKTNNAVLDVEYIPHFAFNVQHLWRMRTPQLAAAKPFTEYLEARDEDFWEGFDPSYTRRYD